MAQSGGPPPEAVRGGVRRSVLAVSVVVVAVVAFLGGIGFGAVVLPRAPPAKTLFIVATNVPFPPFEDFNTSSGEFAGFDIDISALIATELRRALVIRQFSNFQVLLATVGSGGVDMGASAITSSGASGLNRSRFMSFSASYYDANQGILVKSTSTFACANPSNCTGTDLRNLRVGVQQGTTSQAWMNDNKHPSTTVTPFTAVDTMIAALKAGSIDAVVIDYGPAQTFAAAPGSGLRAAGLIITNELYSFAVPLGDPDRILPVINQVLTRIKADGTYNQLIAKWFR